MKKDTFDGPSGSSDAPAVTCSSTQVHSTYHAGSGTSADPYLICTSGQFLAIQNNSSDWSKSFKLGANIDLTGVTAAQITGIGTVGNPFTGSFNGNSYSIKNLTASVTGANNIGLWSYVGTSSFSNLTIENFTLTTVGGLLAGLALFNTTGTVTMSRVKIKNSTFNATLISGAGFGGLIWQGNNITCSYCDLETVTFNNSEVFGGIAGSCVACNFANSSITGLVSASNLNFGGRVGFNGGIVGSSSSNLSISNSTVSMSATGLNNALGAILGNSSTGALSITGVTATVTNTTMNGGGLIYAMSAGSSATITDSGISGTLTMSCAGCSVRLGGLISTYNSASTTSISRSFSKLAITASTSGGLTAYLGGLVGSNISGSGTINITDSYVRANLSATGAGASDGRVGGIVGESNAGSTFNLTRNYYSGAASGAGGGGLSGAGCIFGYQLGTLNTTDNYYDTTTCVAPNSVFFTAATPAGTTGQNTAAMQPAGAFANWANGNWIFAAGAYPKLIWE